MPCSQLFNKQYSMIFIYLVMNYLGSDSIDKNVNVSVYSLKSLLSSEDFTIWSKQYLFRDN